MNQPFREHSIRAGFRARLRRAVTTTIRTDGDLDKLREVAHEEARQIAETAEDLDLMREIVREEIDAATDSMEGSA